MGDAQDEINRNRKVGEEVIDPAAEVDKLSFMNFWSIDRILLKVIILLLPTWCKLSAALAATQPGGVSDAILGILPIAVISAFALGCAWRLYRAVSQIKESDVKEQEFDFSKLAQRKTRRPKPAVKKTELSSRSSSSQEQQQQHRSGSSAKSSRRSRNARTNKTTTSTKFSLAPSAQSEDTKSLVFASQNRFVTSASAAALALLDPLLGAEEMSPMSGGSAPEIFASEFISDEKNVDRRLCEMESLSLLLAASKTSYEAGDPVFFVEKSELFFPYGASSDTQHRLHRLLQHWFCRFMLIGYHTWYNPYLVLKTNNLVPGPGLLTQFPWIFNTFFGPTKKFIQVDDVEEIKKLKRATSSKKGQRRSASSLSAIDIPKKEKMVFESTWKHHLSTIWIFVSIVVTIIATSVSGAGDVNPSSCYGAFLATLFTSLPKAIATLFVLPYLVPLRNTASIILEWSTAIGGLLFAYVLMDENTTLGEAQSTIAIAQVITTLPAATLGTAMSGFGIVRVGMLRMAKSKIVTRTALREHLPVELEIARGSCLGRIRLLRSPRRHSLDSILLGSLKINLIVFF